MKKRLLILILALLMLLTACGEAETTSSAGPQSGDDGQTSFVLEGTTAYFKLVDVGEGSALAMKVLEDGSHESLYRISTAGGEDLCPGMVVEVAWDGLIMESYPAILSGVTALRVVEQQDDLVGFYRQVLNDLWENDAALNHDVTTLGFDFSGLTNLTEGEQSALKYLVSCDFGLGLQYVFGSWEELCDEGYIDKENLYWEDGVFLSITVTEEGNDKFTFEAQKWCSGTGAIWFKGCTAARGDNGKWSYEMGSFAIS